MRDSEKSVCRICLGVHDEEIHAATLSVHAWFREQVTLGLWDDNKEEPEAPAAAVA